MPSALPIVEMQGVDELITVAEGRLLSLRVRRRRGRVAQPPPPLAKLPVSRVYQGHQLAHSEEYFEISQNRGDERVA